MMVTAHLFAIDDFSVHLSNQIIEYPNETINYVMICPSKKSAGTMIEYYLCFGARKNLRSVSFLLRKVTE